MAHIKANPSQPETGSGTCSLPNGDSVEMGADECAKQKGHWSPKHSYTGWVGRGGGLEEPGEAEDPGESAADEAGEEAAEGAAPIGGLSTMSSWGEKYDRKVELEARVEELANRGNPEALISYWREGAGADRIEWGTDGDFTRCMKLVGKYLPDDAGGFCQNRHMEIYGESNAARDKKQDAQNANN